MNKKGIGPIGAIFLFIVFIIMWFIWLAAWINNTGEQIIVENNLVGVEAFFFSNLNLVVFVCMLMGVMGWIYFSSVT